MHGPRMLLLAAVTVVLGACGAAQGADAHGQEPQLISGLESGLVTALTTLIIFALLLAVLGRYAWGPIADGLRKREERIRKDIADAEAARARAEATLREYQQQLATAEEQVRQMIASATRDGEKLASEIRAKGQKEAEEARQRASREIEEARKHALAQIYAAAADLSTSIAARILRRNINPEDQRDLVERSLDQLQTVEK